MGVDQAYEQLKAIRQALPPEDDRPITDNEACTRVHLIDPILTRVLGWPLEQIAVEAPATLDALAGVSGVGEAKLARYGQQILDVLNG